MKKYLFCMIGFMLFYNVAMADSSGYGISLGYGEADSDIDIYRIGLKKEMPSKWFETDIGHLSCYFELSYNRWRHSTQDIDGVALSPVFVYAFGDGTNQITPYIEGGVGLAYIDEYHIADRNLSTNFQFEDRVGVGARIGLFDLNFRYMHYSNGSIKSPNNGINIFLFTTALQF